MKNVLREESKNVHLFSIFHMREKLEQQKLWEFFSIEIIIELNIYKKLDIDQIFLNRIIIIIIIIIMSRHQHGYPWLSFATPPYCHCFRQVLRATSRSTQSCCMYVRADRPAFIRPCERVHRSTSLMCSSLLLQQCPACLVRLNFIVFVMGGRWPYSCCFVGCCLQDLFNISRSILV